jgi:hypothetical protein
MLAGNEPREVLSKYFDERLTHLFIEDHECRAAQQGLCRIDFMVLYHAQDAEISNLRVCAPGKENGWLDVRFRNNAVRETVSYRVVRAGHQWRISDVRYEDGSSLVSLLSKRM